MIASSTKGKNKLFFKLTALQQEVKYKVKKVLDWLLMGVKKFVVVKIEKESRVLKQIPIKRASFRWFTAVIKSQTCTTNTKDVTHEL